MAILFKNIFGSPQGLNVQREDLWYVDMTDVIASKGQPMQGITLLNVLLNPGTPGLGYLKDKILKSDNLFYYCKSIGFPEQKIKTEEYKKESSPIFYPGYDEPLGPVRCVFYLDIPASNGLTTESVIYNVLSGWMSLVRTGRVDDFNTLSLPNKGYKPTYRFDVPINLLAAIDVSSNSSDYSATLRPRVSTVFSLQDCWIQSLQLSDFQYEGSKPLTVTAQLMPRLVRTTPSNVVLQPIPQSTSTTPASTVSNLT